MIEKKLCNVMKDHTVIAIYDFLSVVEFDVSIGDIEKGAGKSRKTVDTWLPRMVEEGIIVQTRLVGNTKMFKLSGGF